MSMNRVHCIPQSSRSKGASPSDCFVSYPRNSFRESYPSAEMQWVYSTAPVDWSRFSWCILQPQLTGPQDTCWWSLTPLQRCIRCILQPQVTGPPDTCWGSLTPLQRCSQCILQPQLTGPQDTCWGEGVLPLCRDVLGVFCSPSYLVFSLILVQCHVVDYFTNDLKATQMNVRHSLIWECSELVRIGP